MAGSSQKNLMLDNNILVVLKQISDATGLSEKKIMEDLISLAGIKYSIEIARAKKFLMENMAANLVAGPPMINCSDLLAVSSSTALRPSTSPTVSKPVQPLFALRDIGNKLPTSGLGKRLGNDDRTTRQSRRIRQRS